MLWLVGRLSGEPGSDARKKLVLAACDCSQTVAHLADKDGQMAIAWCLMIAREWATGGDADLEDVRAADAYAADAAAAYAAYAAAYAAYAAAYAAYAAADAAYAAAYAAYAADDDADARTKTLADCADIVRQHYRRAPRLGGAK